MTKVVIDKETELAKLENMLANLTDEKDIQSVRFAINVISGFNEPRDEWIPIKYRPLTVDERIAFAEHYGIEYCDTENEKAFDCLMPEDGQEILVSRSWGVVEDVADNDIDGEGFIVYGLYANGDWEGIDAWMPKPETYKAESESKE